MRLVQLIRIKQPRTRSGTGFNTFCVDIVEVSATKFQLRAFKVSEAKTTYAVMYGLLKKHHHKLDSDGERRERWWEEEFENEAAAKAALDEKCKEWKATGSRIIVPRKQKLYS